MTSSKAIWHDRFEEEKNRTSPCRRRQMVRLMDDIRMGAREVAPFAIKFGMVNEIEAEEILSKLKSSQFDNDSYYTFPRQAQICGYKQWGNWQSKRTFGKVNATNLYVGWGKLGFISCFDRFLFKKALKRAINDLKRVSNNVRSCFLVFRTW